MARKGAGKEAAYRCKDCGKASGQWLGRCDGCQGWGTLEEVGPATGGAPGLKAGEAVRAIPLTEVPAGSGEGVRLETGIAELDRVLGGGLVKGALILLGGEPGIGKSTLLLQLSTALARKGRRVLYVAGEESPHQIRLRADRVGAAVAGIEVFPGVEVEAILAELTARPPELVVVDSIQTLRTAASPGLPGSAAQLAACAHPFMALAKSLEIPTVLVAHVNKEGDIAGPKLLEHMVDVVLYFEGDRDQGLRFLRSVKNRFGPAGELGVFRMEEAGLAEVRNPSALFFSEEDLGLAGTAVAVAVEGSRAYLIEVQALVAPASHSYPRRVAQGFDAARLTVLASVLERRLGVPLSRHDVFVKLTGGLQMKEPALDLPLAVAILSSAAGKALPARRAFAAELGLGAELRPIGQVEKRIREAARLGFAEIFVPEGAPAGAGKPAIVASAVRSLTQVVERVFPEGI